MGFCVQSTKAQETDTELWNALELSYKINKDWKIAVEQNLRFNEEIGNLDRVQTAGAKAVLVGEALMRQADVESALHSLIHG